MCVRGSDFVNILINKIHRSLICILGVAWVWLPSLTCITFIVMFVGSLSYGYRSSGGAVLTGTLSINDDVIVSCRYK